MAHYEHFRWDGEMDCELVPDCDETNCSLCDAIIKLEDVVCCARCAANVCVRCLGASEFASLALCLNCVEQIITLTAEF